VTWEQIELFEEWRQVVGFEGFYEVSNWGRVRSVARGTGRKTGKLLIARSHIRDEYLSVVLSTNLRNATEYKIHRLVLEAFKGPCPENKEVDHIDGNRTNNTLPNLRYLDHAENMRAAVGRRGKWQKPMVFPVRKGAENPAAKLTTAHVNDIRRLRIEGMTVPAIAKEFGVTPRHIFKILSGELRKEG
jgi:HNH endonuclease/NUMOD4 motif